MSIVPAPLSVPVKVNVFVDVPLKARVPVMLVFPVTPIMVGTVPKSNVPPLIVKSLLMAEFA
jgi:hypothetical protein